MNAPSLDLAGYRVAVVDDNRNFRELLRTMLRAFGVRRVDSLAEPDDVVPFLCQNFVDLVFIDLVMPGADGIRLARDIRHKPGIAKRNAPIVLVTGHASRATVIKAVAAGIDDIVVKPVSPRTILGRARRLLLKPPRYVSGVDGYYGPDVVERRRAVERRLTADRWRLLKAPPRPTAAAVLAAPARPPAMQVVLLDELELRPSAPLLPGFDARVGWQTPPPDPGRRS